MEDVVEESKEESGKNRNSNHDQSEGDGLFARRPRDVRELASSILDVVHESIHVFGIKKRPSAFSNHTMPCLRMSTVSLCVFPCFKSPR